MPTINDELMAYMETSSRIALTDDEKRRLAGDFQEILSSMERLAEFDTAGVPECSHPFDNANVFRDDEVTASFDRELILKNAPESGGKMFAAPKTVG